MDKSINQSTDPEIIEEIGRRLRSLRQARALTMNQVAERTGLDRTTVSRAEHGKNPTLLTLIRLLRTYGRLGALDSFVPEPEVSPMELLRRQRRGRSDA